MSLTVALPSIVVFGPHCTPPSSETTKKMRHILASHPKLDVLRAAIEDLPRLWFDLSRFDLDLVQIPGETYVSDLIQWIENDNLACFNHQANTASLPLMVLLQAALYIDYADSLGVDKPHETLLSNLQEGGFQGFCLGFLTAVALSFSETENDIASYISISLRLALCVGAYIDKESTSAQLVSDTVTFAIRWKDEDWNYEMVQQLLENYPETYVACINDKNCFTITTPTHLKFPVTNDLQCRGFRVRYVDIRGRFHCKAHESDVSKLQDFCLSNQDLQFPVASRLCAPLLSNINISGQKIFDQPLHDLVAQSLLSHPADWYNTMKGVFENISPDMDHTILSIGFGESPIPRSLMQQAGNIHIVSIPRMNEKKEIHFSGHQIDPRGIKTEEIPRLPDVSTTDGIGESHLYPTDSIAVVGMACMFPGAESTDEFWKILLSGQSMATAPPLDRLSLNNHRVQDRDGISWWGNFLHNPNTFDHRFFKKSAREVLYWDPSKRLLLEVVYQALESSGYFGVGCESKPKDYGCYIGAVANNYYDNVSCHPPTAYSMLGTSRAFFSGRLSHQFGFTGPSMSIDTACSSSLVAINEACKAIQSGECSRAVAGGTNVFTSPFDYQNLAAAGFLSPTGQCKPFDVSADGYCRGEGVGVVVLKSLSYALKENDHILGVIVGSTVNQNFNDNHITVPCSASQTSAYNRVLALAKVSADTVSYVEAHGTGTQVGDPIECQSIRDAFGGSDRTEDLYFGSVKGHIGHTEASAGVAGLIKVLLMMHNKIIPKQASFSNLNPKIPALKSDRMAIPIETQNWNSPSRLACINSYGAAGSNAVIAVREGRGLRGTAPTLISASGYPLILTAASEKSLTAYAQKLLSYLRSDSLRQPISEMFSDLVFNVSCRANSSLPAVAAAKVSSIEEMDAFLQETISSGAAIFQKDTPTEAKPVVMVFGGQDSEIVGIPEESYKTITLFRHHLDACETVLRQLEAGSLFPSVFQSNPITDLPTLHSALFSVQYASAKCWIDCGLKVNAVIGHSFGQLTALCISGRLSLYDTLKLVVGRAKLMESCWGSERGCMIAVQTSRENITKIIEAVHALDGDKSIEVACFNGPNSHVLVGSAASVQSLEQVVSSNAAFRDLARLKRLNVTHGFHSRFTKSLLPHLVDLAETLTWHQPNILLETCTELKSFEGLPSTLVAEHTRKPVFFEQAVQRLSQRFMGHTCTWIEAGHGSSVVQLLRSCLSAEEVSKNSIVPSPLKLQNAGEVLAHQTIDLWKSGKPVQFWAFHFMQKQQYRYLTIPPYQFEKTQHWLPFTAFEDREPVKMLDAITSVPPERFLIKFDGYQDHSAMFSVDPESERYRKLLSGHITSGQALAPVSLYIELLSRAVLQHHPDSKSYASKVVRIDSLQMKAPIGLDIARDIVIRLNPITSAETAWDFVMSSAPKGVVAPTNSKTHIKGVISLVQRQDSQLARVFRRYEALIGLKRCYAILEDPKAEMMRGKHIYQAIERLVHFDLMYQGIKSIACRGNEAAGRVTASVDPSLAPPERLYDAPMIDSLMQLAGILVNYFRHPSLDEVLVCLGIDLIETGGTFEPDTKEWIVYAVSTDDSEQETRCDVYVFDEQTGKLVLTFLGFHFVRTSQSAFSQSLKEVNGSKISYTTTDQAPKSSPGPVFVQKEELPSQVMTNGDSMPLSMPPGSSRGELFDLIHAITDIPLDEINDDSTLEDLGIDSLLVTEVLNEIRSTFGLEIDMNTFLLFPNLEAVYTYLDLKLVDVSAPPQITRSTDNSKAGKATSVETSFANGLRSDAIGPRLLRARDAFEDIRYHVYDRFAVETKAANFWRDVFPQQASLVLAYVVEGFAKLGCDLRQLHTGDILPNFNYLPRHKRLVRQLHCILQDAKIITIDQAGDSVRTAVTIDPTPASRIFDRILKEYPQHANVHKLVQVTGSELAECLTGAKDGLQLVFGNKVNKKNLDDVYENWPLVRSATLTLGEYVVNIFANPDRPGKFRILEIGAGTGGTTKHIVDHLQRHGITFEYTFTDLSSSLVAAARRRFTSVPGMTFRVMDVEKEPAATDMASYHLIISTNCIHATEDLTRSLTNIRKMLRDDGVVALVEITRNMFWLDIAVGLFEGWWLFNDGREHAVTSETLWDKCMRDAGFSDVLWTDGSEPEAGTIRVIAGFLG